jgi:hypothetical protein
MRQGLGLVALIGWVGAATGCMFFPGYGEPVVAPEPEPERQAPVVAPPISEAPVARVEVPAQAPPVEVAELRAALGETADSAAVKGLVDRLGAPEVRGTAAEPIQAFVDHGVFLRYGGDGRVAEVALFGAGEKRSAFRGALPGGLRFGMSAGDVEAALGVDIPHREVGRRDNTRVFHAAIDGGRTFRGHGLRVHFGRDRGLSFVVMLPNAGPGDVYLDDAIAYPGEEGGVHGLRVYYQLSVVSPACADLDVELRIADAAAVPVKGRAPGRAKPAEFNLVERDVACVAADRMLFVPFAELELPVGRQEVRMHLAARLANERAKRGKSKPVAAVSAPASVEMPAVVLVRLKVSAGIDREVFSRRNTVAALTFGISALGSRPKLSPDPFWVMQAGKHHHRSKTRPSTYTPRWAESTEWFPLAEGDHVMLYFADEDVGDNERLATFRIGVEQLRAAIREKVVLKADWVESLVLEGSEIREGGTPVRSSR